MVKLKTNFLSKVLYGVVIIGILILTGMLIGLPWVTEHFLIGDVFSHDVSRNSVLILLYATGVLAWIILWMTKKLTENIMNREPFSKSSIESLKWISLCSIGIFLGYLVTCIFIQITLGLIIIAAGAFMIALIAAILYRLVQLALEIQEENELTI